MNLTRSADGRYLTLMLTGYDIVLGTANVSATVTVLTALFGIDTGVSFILEKSTNAGVAYTAVAGASATLTNTLMAYSFMVN